MKVPTDAMSASQIRDLVKAAIDAATASMMAAMKRQHRVLIQKAERADTNGDGSTDATL